MCVQVDLSVGESMQTVFRGTTVTSKVMAFCFRMFGYDYLYSLLNPFVARLISNDRNFATSYEVDPARYQYQQLNCLFEDVLAIRSYTSTCV